MKKFSKLKTYAKPLVHERFEHESYDTLDIEKVQIDVSEFFQIGIKTGTIRNSSFLHSVFTDCYFRNCTFIDVDFTGCQFLNCNFEKASFQSCNFRYARFSNCLINTEEILSNLPTHSNQKLYMLRFLHRNSIQISDYKSADRILLVKEKAEQEELANIVLSRTQYYKANYDFLKRLGAFRDFLKHILSGVIWGHGLKLTRLLFSALFFILGCSAVIYFGEVSLRKATDGALLSGNFIEALVFSYSYFIGDSTLDYFPGTPFARVLSIFLRTLGIVYLGLFASLVFKKITYR